MENFIKPEVRTNLDKESLLSNLSISSGFEISQERQNKNAYRLQKSLEGKTVTLRILFNDETGSDIVITNMTVLPEEERGGGFGGDTIKNFIEICNNYNVNEIRATQINSEDSERFWVRLGFKKDDKHVDTGDYIYAFR